MVLYLTMPYGLIFADHWFIEDDQVSSYTFQMITDGLNDVLNITNMTARLCKDGVLIPLTDTVDTLNDGDTIEVDLV